MTAGEVQSWPLTKLDELRDTLFAAASILSSSDRFLAENNRFCAFTGATSASTPCEAQPDEIISKLKLRMIK